MSKAPVSVAVNGPASGQIGEALTLRVKVTRGTDGAPAKSVHVQYPSGSKTTSDAGEVTFNYTIGASGGIGPREVDVHSTGTGRYLAGTDSPTIRAKPKTN